VAQAARSRPSIGTLTGDRRFTAQQFLSEMLPQLDEELTGLRNQGLLSTHELRVGVPERDDWADATEQARRALDDDDPREMVKGLNYEIDQLTDQSYVLKDSSDGHERAVAMFLQEDESSTTHRIGSLASRRWPTRSTRQISEIWTMSSEVAVTRSDCTRQTLTKGSAHAAAQTPTSR